MHRGIGTAGFRLDCRRAPQGNRIHVSAQRMRASRGGSVERAVLGKGWALEAGCERAGRMRDVGRWTLGDG